MSPTALIINGFAGAVLVAAGLYDRRRAGLALRLAVKMFVRIIPMVVLIITLIGALFAFVAPAQLEEFLGARSGPVGTVVVALVGGVLHIPALLAFPLSASLLDRGASVSVVAAFIASLTMIGMVTLPLEIRELGRRFALIRNGLSFVAALAIAALMEVVL